MSTDANAVPVTASEPSTLDTILNVVGQVPVYGPIASIAVRTLWNIWSTSKPTGTFEEFISDMTSEAAAGRAEALAWKLAHPDA